MQDGPAGMFLTFIRIQIQDFCGWVAGGCGGGVGVGVGGGGGGKNHHRNHLHNVIYSIQFTFPNKTIMSE